MLSIIPKFCLPSFEHFKMLESRIKLYSSKVYSIVLFYLVAVIFIYEIKSQIYTFVIKHLLIIMYLDSRFVQWPILIYDVILVYQLCKSSLLTN